MNAGYIRLYRRFTEWGWYNDINTSRLFIHCLLCANWEDKKWRGIEVKRGQFVTSLSELSQQTLLTVQQLRTSISRLKSTNEITVETTNKYTLISVIKYDYYQYSDTSTNKQNNKQPNKRTTNEQQTTNKRATTTKELKALKALKALKNTYLLNLINEVEIAYSRKLSESEKKELEFWLENFDKDLVEMALRESIIYQVLNFDYVDKILNEWNAKGLDADRIKERTSVERRLT